MADNNVYNRQLTDNQAVLLAQKLVFESSQFELWGRWMKFNTPKKEAVNPNGKNALTLNNTPIVVHRELQKQAGDHCRVPMFRNLDQLPKYGEEQMAGHEEKQKINHATVYLNLVRHGMFKKTSSMNWQTTKQYDIAKWAKSQLQNHYAKVNSRLGVSNAFYKGFSDNIINDSTWFDGNGANAPSGYSHPHIYVAGDSKVSYGTVGYPGTSTYETAVGTAISGLGNTNVFDTALLNGLKAEPQIRKIGELYTKDGTPYRIIVANPYQINDLMLDPDFKAIAQNALGGAKELAKENPYLVGCKWFWNGWAIFDGGHLIWPVSVSAGDPVWGYNGTITLLSDLEDWADYTAFGAIVLGDNAMAKATGSPMNFRTRTDDYDEVTGTAYRIIEAYARNDFKNLNDGTAGQYMINDSSAIVVTYAAKPSLG
jgi:hypothetical protein